MDQEAKEKIDKRKADLAAMKEEMGREMPLYSKYREAVKETYRILEQEEQWKKRGE